MNQKSAQSSKTCPNGSTYKRNARPAQKLNFPVHHQDPDHRDTKV